MAVDSKDKNMIKPKTTSYSNKNKKSDNSKKIVISILTVILIVLLSIFFIQIYKFINPNTSNEKVEELETSTQNPDIKDFNATEENKEENKEDSSKKSGEKEINTQEIQEDNTQQSHKYLENKTPKLTDGYIKNANGEIVVTSMEIEQISEEHYAVRGAVENRSEDSVYSSMLIQITYYDKNGEKVNRGITQIVDYNGVMPKETVQFGSIDAFTYNAVAYEIEIIEDYNTEKLTSNTKRNTSSGDTVQSRNGDIVVENLSIQQQSEGFYNVSGTVKNDSKSTSYSLVEMKIAFYDKNGKMINTDMCYVVDYNVLAPNKSRDFSSLIYVFGTVGSYEVEIMESYRIE